jgi:hypothetical protein
LSEVGKHLGNRARVLWFSSIKIATADAKFGISVGMTAISSTSSFFFISQSFEASRRGAATNYRATPSSQHQLQGTSPTSIRTADAKFGIKVGIIAIKSTSIFFFI